MSTQNKELSTIVRAIKSISKSTDGLTPSQKKRMAEMVIDEIGEDLYLQFSSFSALANESYTSIKEREELVALENEEALKAIIEAAKSTSAFENSKMSPEAFLSKLLQPKEPPKRTKKPKTQKTPVPTEPSATNQEEQTPDQNSSVNEHLTSDNSYSPSVSHFEGGSQ